MKRELGIARCGLACCLCSENDHCSGCNSGDCPDKEWCEIENVLLIITFHIVLNAIKIVEKDYCQRSNLMDLHFSLKDMDLKNY